LPANERIEVTIMGADQKVFWHDQMATSESGDLELIFEKLEKGFYLFSLRYISKVEFVQIIKDK
jgi:hypothetical protein